MRFLICTANIDPCPADAVSSIAFDEVLDFAALGVTPEQILYVAGWGCGFVIGLWAIGYAVSVGVGLIRKA